MILNSSNIQEIKTRIQKIKKTNPDEIIIVKAQDEDFNRKILETKGVNVLLAPEIHNRKDKMKQRDSGLNEFLCKLAKKNNISIAISIREIQSLPIIHKSKVLARIKQNITLCKKTKTKLIVWPKGQMPKQDIMAFMLSLGSSTQQAKQAVE